MNTVCNLNGGTANKENLYRVYSCATCTVQYCIGRLVRPTGKIIVITPKHHIRTYSYLRKSITFSTILYSGRHLLESSPAVLSLTPADCFSFRHYCVHTLSLLINQTNRTNPSRFGQMGSYVQCSIFHVFRSNCKHIEHLSFLGMKKLSLRPDRFARSEYIKQESCVTHQSSWTLPRRFYALHELENLCAVHKESGSCTVSCDAAGGCGTSCK